MKAFVSIVLAALACRGAAEALPMEGPGGRLAPEALARYAAPGEPARYAELIRSLAKPAEELGAPARNLRLPVQSHPDGRPKVMVRADEAWASPDMMWLRGRNVRLESLTPEGAVEAVLEADEAAVDRKAMLAVAKGRVRARNGEDRLTGVGALADLEAHYVRILSKGTIWTKRLGGVSLTERGLF